ncbi:caspase family protein [Sulfitobacter sp.]|uniref:caspase family protein n=1 Tax=Sulfitobacter sp. TaxID=1903071 RepID=UPI003567C8EF
MLRIALIIMIFIGANPALAERRVAMVIGNSDYQHATRLPNPQNDAKAISAKLTTLGFDVFLHENLGGQDFRVALGAFAEEALRADLAVVFYAGHGIEMGGRNYLIPIDAKMTSEATAQFEALSLDSVLTTVRNAGKLGLIMLDACRDNPFANTMTRKNGTRAVSRGLAPVSLDGEAGTLVSFAAQAGDTADDGTGMHSPYTEALLELLDQPGLEVGALFQRVTKVVKDKTGGRQKPMYRIQPPEDLVYLVPQDAAYVPPPTILAPEAPQPRQEDPLIVYLAAVQSQTRSALEDFIARYPNHAKTADAKKLLFDIADREFWEVTKQQDTISAYNTYILAFSNGQFAARAKARKQVLELAAAPKPTPKPAPPAPQPNPQMSGIRTSCPALNAGASVQSIRTNDTLFVRAEGGKNFPVVGELPYNANGVNLGSCSSSGWCAVTYGCISGYSFEKYLRRGTGGHSQSRYAGQYHVVNHPLDQKLNVRSGPSTKYAVIAELPPTAVGVTVADCQMQRGFSKPWCALQWQGISGWAYGKYLADTSGRNPQP